MCISAAPADFKGTKLYIGEGLRYGKNVHVLGYQNTPISYAGPNCMLLHFPTAAPMTGDNVMDTSGCSDFMDDLVETVRPQTRGLTKGMAFSAGMSPNTHVFDHDIYTIILTDKASDMRAALEQVPEARRPEIKTELILFYAKHFPGYSFALCCFDNAKVVEADPLLWWYEPKDPDKLMAPAVDAHDGHAPDLEKKVDVDHWIITGTSDFNGSNPYMNEVKYTKPVPDELEGLLPTHAIGIQYTRQMDNGDFVTDTEVFNRKCAPRFEREVPVAQ